MDTIKLNTYKDDVQTSISIDNTGGFKDFEISQGNLIEAEKLTIQIAESSGDIVINNVVFSGINKKLLIDFITQ